MFNPRNFRVQRLASGNFKGDVVIATAGGTLNVGDVVYWSAAGTVNKSTTSANYAAFAGVVVAGPGTSNLFTADDVTNVVGTQAATVGQDVYVQINGIATVQTAAAVAVNAILQVATTAGQVDDPAVVAGQCVGIALAVAAGASVKIPMLIQPK